MNTRLALLALHTAIAMLSLALFITVVAATASSINSEVVGMDADTDTSDGMVKRLLANQRTNISSGEPLSPTAPISIYLPLLAYNYIDPASERAALMALYNSTNGDQWTNSAGWGTNSSHCEWYGITCDEDGYVMVIDLDRNKISGTLPSEIGNLPLLTILRLTGTNDYGYYQLSDPLPPEIGNLAHLQELDLGGNRFTILPPQIGNLARLKVLRLKYNLLSSLPPEVGNLVHLQELDLWYNQLSSLPPEIGNLVNLLKLHLNNNQLSSLPPEIGNLTNLQELNLDWNGLISLPSEIGNLASLKVLPLRFNQLSSLPPGIGNFQNLQVLNLIYNQLSSLPPEIGNLASLKDLELGFNQISSLPSEIGNLANLQELDVWNNRLSYVPLEIGNLASLQELDLGRNQLKSIPPEIGKLTSLQGLNLDQNQLNILPSKIGNLASLQWLLLSSNQLSGPIPVFLTNLVNLNHLDLSNNPDLTCWETEEARDWALSLADYDGPTCVSYKVFTVMENNADNRIHANREPYISQSEPLTLTEPISIYLPLLGTEGYLDQSVERAALVALYNSTNGDEWYNNTGWGTDASYCEWYGVTCDENDHVTILDLGWNKISGTLPAEIGDLLRLTELRLGGTPDLGCKGGCQYLFAIQDPLPPEIGKLMNLRVLDMTGNKLTYLPPEIGNLENLQRLVLDYSQFTSLPPEIGNLASLQNLDLAGNQLTSLPPEIGNLANLRVLDLGEYWGRNQLSSLAAEICKLVNLQVLDLSYNQFTFLPGEISNLASLQVLDLRDNQLTSFLPEIGNLASLQVLDLGNNNLSGPIPAYLSNLGDLTSLTLWGNSGLTCWETEEARDWALSLEHYDGPTCVSSE